MAEQDPSFSASPSSSNPGFNIRMSDDELLSHVLDWNLGCDTAVLNRLKDYSQNMLKRAETIKAECNSCVHEVDMLQTRVQGVTNQFLSLANDQFVENCVEEFEERDLVGSQASAAPLVHQVKTKAEKEAELIKKMKESIQLGIKSNSFCDQLSNVPKVKTAHIIGTSKFFGSRFCGLLEGDCLRPATKPTVIEPIDTRLNLNSSSYAAGLSESISIPKAPSSTDSEYLFQPRENTQSQLSKRESSLSSEDNFLSANPPAFTSSSNSVETNHSHESDLKKPSEFPTGRPPISIIDDLNKVFQSRVPPPVVGTSDSDEDLKSREDTGRNLFADEDDDLFTSNSNQGVSSRPPQVPADSLFTPPVVPNPTPVVSKPSAANQINSIADLIRAQQKPQEQKPAKPEKQSVFRESDSDSEGDLFTTTSGRSATKTTKKITTSQSLFGNSDDLFKPPTMHQQPPPVPASIKAAPRVVDSSSNASQPIRNRPEVKLQKQTKQKSIFDESDSDDDLFSTSSSKRGTSATSTDTEQPSVKTTPSLNIFTSTARVVSNFEPKAPQIIAKAQIVSTKISTPNAEFAEGGEPTPDVARPISEVIQPNELAKPLEEDDSTGARSRKKISQKLENIFKASGPPMPGFPPKRKDANIKHEVPSEIFPQDELPESHASIDVIFAESDESKQAQSSFRVEPPLLTAISDGNANSDSVEQILQMPSLESVHAEQSISSDDLTPTTEATKHIVSQPFRQISQDSVLLSGDDEWSTHSTTSAEHKIDHEPPVTFDNPPTANLLTNVAKNRVKIMHKRRRPTQKPVFVDDEVGNLHSDWKEPAAGKDTDQTTEKSSSSNEESNLANSRKASAEQDLPSTTSNTPGGTNEPESTIATTKAIEKGFRSPHTDRIEPLPVSNDEEVFSVKVEKENRTLPNCEIKTTTSAPSSVAINSVKSIPEPKETNPKSFAEDRNEVKGNPIDMSKSVFEDSDSDSDIFSPVTAKTRAKPDTNKTANGLTLPSSSGKVIAKPPKVKASIFTDSDSESGEDLFAAAKTTTTTKTLQNVKDRATNPSNLISTGERISEKELCPSTSQPSSARIDKEQVLEKPSTKPEVRKGQPSKLKQKSIFDDSDSDSDMFSSKSSKFT